MKILKAVKKLGDERHAKCYWKNKYLIIIIIIYSYLFIGVKQDPQIFHDHLGLSKT